MRNFANYDVDIHGKSSGVLKTICKKCLPTRKNKRDRSLRVNVDTGHCHCYHCGADFYVPDDVEERKNAERVAARKRRAAAIPQHFQRPVFDASKTTLSEDTERWLVETRCIPQSVIAALRITEQEEFMPQSGKKERCICFNYFEGEQLINTKFRALPKLFKMVQGAELIPYNIDSILGQTSCIIHEGELDAASSIAAGFKSAISVPAGANSNLSWLDRFMETHFEDLEEIIIAVDADSAGIRLRNELINRLGAERCRVVTYGPECKDANEHLVRYGVSSLLFTLAQAEEVPLEGVFTTNDCLENLRILFENGLCSGADTGWENLDKNCTFETGRFMVVTGLPGHGKSEFIDELALRLCLRHEWKIAYFSPENSPVEYHHAKLFEKLTGLHFGPGAGMTEALYNHTLGWLADNVTHILPGNDAYTVDTILEKARQLVYRRGVRILIIDPLNRLDQQLEAGQTELMYITSLLGKLSRFAIQHKCLVILVAHPRKVNRSTATGELRRVEMNDINGSANFFNMTDYGIVVDRQDEMGIVYIHVEKTRFRNFGTKGNAAFCYDVTNGRYSPCTPPPEPGMQVQPWKGAKDLFSSEGWI